MIGRYDRIDSVDIIYRDKIYPNTYLLTGADIISDFEVDLEGDLDFNEMQTSNRRTVCQLNDIYDLFDFMDAQGIYYRPYCMTPDTLLVGGEKDCLIQPDLTFSWADEINACRKITSSRKFAKYPQGYVKASFDINPYMKDLSDYLEYLSDDEIDELEVDTYAEPCAWMIIPEHLRDTVEKAVGLDYCSPSENYYYYIEYHPDDDSIHFGIDTDLNLETLRGVSKQTEDRFKAKFKKELGIKE